MPPLFQSQFRRDARTNATPTIRVSLIFDDGLVNSCRRVADIFEEFRLPAVFAAIAQPKAFQRGLASWEFWRDMRMRGHLIHPHGWNHALLTSMPEADAIENIQLCLDAFEEAGFPVANTVFHYPYNSGTRPLHERLLTRVAGVRVGGTGHNSISDLQSRVLHCTANGPNGCDEHLLEQLNTLKTSRPAAFIYNLHGLDGEGWGPLRSDTLRRVLTLLSTSNDLNYWPLETEVFRS